jgi:hypothetical protein
MMGLCRPSGALWIVSIVFPIVLPPLRGLVWRSLKKACHTLNYNIIVPLGTQYG